MKTRFAFAGFRHGHILALYDAVKKSDNCEVVAACEEHVESREALAKAGTVTFTDDSIQSMLQRKDIDVVAIGDVYARRGAIAIAALESGRHIISDKPICTSLVELDRIEQLAREKKLCVGCQLDLREVGTMTALRDVVQSGQIGEPVTVTITGQHPLRIGVRPSWYFEVGQHGGTINDIGIHAFDLVDWLTGRSWEKVLCAREWNAKAKPYPHFKDCAQVYGVLEGGIGVFGDFSYLAPNEAGFDMPQYWRVTVHGTAGVAETGCNIPHVEVCSDSDKKARTVPANEKGNSVYLQDFLLDMQGKPRKDGLTTERVIRVSRWALSAQQQASANGK